MLTSKSKHLLHCCLLFTIIITALVLTARVKLQERISEELINPWLEYGFLTTIVLCTFRLVCLLSLPQVLFNFIGLTYYNAFPDKVVLKASPLLSPFICIRVVTRGDFPQLVKDNVNRNMNKCLDAGLDNFLIEVVTDKSIGLEKHRKLREIVVPMGYRTKTGALFKARALQYCLEDGVNLLEPDNWVVHLDEETLLTENCVKGILNFVCDGKYDFGQGLITYANEEVVNWVTTIADSFRVTDDMGKLKLQFKMFHKPLFSWKGSFVVTKFSAERDVSFDNGLEGSIAEDCFFAMKAFTKGYSFNFIEGEMWEKSAFTFYDFVQQRKRWLQGIILVVHSKAIPIKRKLLLAISCYSWLTLPISISNILLASKFPVPLPLFVDFICAFIGAVNIYMFVFGVLKSFTVHRFGLTRFILCLMASVLIIPFNLVMENIAVIWGICGRKNKFHVVNKTTTNNSNRAPSFTV